MHRFFLFLLALASTPVFASLTNADFLNPNDRLLVRDSVTNLEWLTPVYTRNNTYNNATIQNINSTYGFRYATAAEALSLINDNFGNPTSVHPGNVAGYNSAQAFFNLFGIAESLNCFDGSNIVPCPRTQGLTSTPGTAGRHLGFGMIQFGANGYSILNNSWPDTTAGLQMGSFLVRSFEPVPEPSSIALMSAGLALLGFGSRRRSRRA